MINQQTAKENNLKKIEYGKKFFKALQKELPAGIEIKYQTRVNSQSLSDVLEGK